MENDCEADSEARQPLDISDGLGNLFRSIGFISVSLKMKRVVDRPSQEVDICLVTVAKYRPMEP